MRPTLRDLIGVLDQETELVRELVEALQHDQQRIVKHDIDGLEASNRVKEERVLRFHACEQTRQNLTARLGQELGIAEGEVRVSTICPRLLAAGEDAERLEASAGRLRALVASLGELVAVSRGFLEQSILGIRGVLALIQTLRSPEPATYDATGRYALPAQAASMTVRREA